MSHTSTTHHLGTSPDQGDWGDHPSREVLAPAQHTIIKWEGAVQETCSDRQLTIHKLPSSFGFELPNALLPQSERLCRPVVSTPDAPDHRHVGAHNPRHVQRRWPLASGALRTLNRDG
eukprot:940158-Pyramimonas_sp.AAC.1